MKKKVFKLSVVKDKVIVCVSASFETGDKLFQTLKKYAQHSDEKFAYYDEFAFSPFLLPECDAVLVFNTPHESIETLCYPENVIAFMMEPGVESKHPWMFRTLKQYDSAYSPIKQSGNTILSHGFLGWYFNQDYSYLSKLSIPEKTKPISCIASGLQMLPGHRLRLQFIKELQEQIPSIDFFGRDYHYLPDKIDGLLPYRYSIAIENSSIPYYFTEKINDCFLAWTVPLYYGCKNIERYFPAGSYIKIDINHPSEAIGNIRSLLANDDWNSRIEALREARELVLHKYQPLAGAAGILRQKKPASGKKNIILKPVEPGLLKKIKTALSKLGGS